ncbi:MAG: hypothetical protein RLZZ292_3434, partial [Bacteroidota bacterium]
TICLCRNEDLLFPEEILEIEQSNFDIMDGANVIAGFELLQTSENQGFKVGHNRFDNAAELFGELKIFGNPIRSAQ